MTARVLITGGGRPTAEQLAAVVVALTPSAEATAPAGPPAWRHAALLEGAGGATVLAPGDLEVTRRGLDR